MTRYSGPRYSGLTMAQASAYRAGGLDIHGQAPETVTASGTGFPCRHCLRSIPEGAPALLVAHRPFEALHPYAEAGPIFLCRDACAPPGPRLPEVLTVSERYLLKGYGPDERIVYGTGRLVAPDGIEAYAEALFGRGDIAFVDVRSATNNCWLARIGAG